MNILRIIVINIKMNSLWFQNIPIELNTIISSYLEYFDFTNFVELVNINYVQAFIINFKEYYNKSLNHDNIKIIYKDLLYLLHEYNNVEEHSDLRKFFNFILGNEDPEILKRYNSEATIKLMKTKYIDVMKFFNLRLAKDPDIVKKYNCETIVYLMENEYIDMNVRIISRLDNLNLFKKFEIHIDAFTYGQFIGNNSYKILKFILEDNIKRKSWLLMEDFDGTQINLIIEDIKKIYSVCDIDIRITELICKYIQFTNEEYEVILSSMKYTNIESYKFLLSKIIDMEGEMVYELLDIMIYNGFDMFQFLYDKFYNKLVDDDILALYFNLLQSNSNGLSNSKIKIFKLLSSHPAIKSSFGFEYKNNEDKEIVDILDELHTLYNHDCFDAFTIYYRKYENILSSDDITELYEDILKSDTSSLNNSKPSRIELLESRLTMLTFLSNQIELKNKVI